MFHVFVGMGISTVTATRILKGQLEGKSGEESRLSMETFPYLALSKVIKHQHLQTFETLHIVHEERNVLILLSVLSF